MMLRILPILVALTTSAIAQPAPQPSPQEYAGAIAALTEQRDTLGSLHARTAAQLNAALAKIKELEAKLLKEPSKPEGPASPSQP